MITRGVRWVPPDGYDACAVDARTTSRSARIYFILKILPMGRRFASLVKVVLCHLQRLPGTDFLERCLR